LYTIISRSREGGRTDLYPDSIDDLMTIKDFKRVAYGKGSNNGFDPFADYLSDDVPERTEIVFQLIILERQIDFILHNYGVQDQRIVDFF
jgi:hypothetical protein